MRGRGAAWVLALVLLAGCAPAPAAEPPEEPEVRVRTHWEALETRAGSLPDVETPWPGGPPLPLSGDSHQCGSVGGGSLSL